jgi:hypothetical protein
MPRLKTHSRQQGKPEGSAGLFGACAASATSSTTGRRRPCGAKELLFRRFIEIGRRLRFQLKGAKWPGFQSHEKVAGDTLLAVGADRYIPGGGDGEKIRHPSIFSLLLSHI